MDSDRTARYNRSWVAVIAACIVVAIAIVVYNFDPATHRWMPKCAFHALTGYDCPSCGNTRLLYHLLHGDIIGAWRYNYFMLIAAPFVALVIYAYAATSPTAQRLRAILFRPSLVFLYALLILAWWLLRNLLGL